MAASVEFEAVGLRHGSEPELLADLSFALPRRSLRVLAGPTGAGKSAVARLILGTRPPSRGRVRVFGEDLAALNDAKRAALRRRIGLVGQAPRLLPHLSVADNIALPLGLAGLGQAEAAPRVAELLAWIGLDHRAGAAPAALDAAAQRLASLARAVVAGPELILVDEPGDLAAQPRLARLLESLHRAGTTILILTRDAALVEAFAVAGLLRLERGRIEDAGVRAR